MLRFSGTIPMLRLPQSQHFVAEQDSQPLIVGWETWWLRLKNALRLEVGESGAANHALAALE
ncbi:hypothetical protein PCCS19_31870 [Paenibacillus sp. CCS19]|nr:hypothetical protein PCCS19_31870 [Paenibacillus cellulosilyticus]